jgi:putative transposase
MYEYRQLSREMQLRLVQQRRAAGLPLHELSHRVNEGNLYLMTATNYEHQPILNTSERRDEFATKLLARLRVLPDTELFAWCLLPNHYHLLLRVDHAVFATLLHSLHNDTATQWNREDATPRRKVWFGYCDRDIRSERHFWTTMNYVHANAVKHGYVRRAYDWAWSSVHQWERDALRQMWHEYPVLNYGEKWDK